MDEPRTQPFNPVKVLVVDDHPNTATTLARGIAQLGGKVLVRSATSGHEALEQIKNDPVDILITDMIMPEMTGLELIEKLQNHTAGHPTFSYLVTAYDVPGMKVTARRLKVKDVIIKPVHPERICRIILNAIDEIHHAQPIVNEIVKTQPFTILIADDQPDNLMLLSRYLDAEGYSHIKAKDGVETLEKARNSQPDLILLDINMPNKDGFAVLEEIRSDPEIVHIPVIILTAARLDPADIQSGLNLGADDYVTKPFDLRELLARIKSVLRRAESTPRESAEPESARFSGFELRLREHRLCDADGAEIPLTHGEFKLLAALARNAQKPLSRDEILDLTHGREAGPYDRTVDMQVTRLRRKLGEDPKLPSLIRSVRGVGYMLSCPVEFS